MLHFRQLRVSQRLHHRLELRSQCFQVMLCEHHNSSPRAALKERLMTSHAFRGPQRILSRPAPLFALWGRFFMRAVVQARSICRKRSWLCAQSSMGQRHGLTRPVRDYAQPRGDPAACRESSQPTSILVQGAGRTDNPGQRLRSPSNDRVIGDHEVLTLGPSTWEKVHVLVFQPGVRC